MKNAYSAQITAAMAVAMTNRRRWKPVSPQVSVTAVRPPGMNRQTMITTSASFVLLVLSTVLDIFQTVMTTTTLDVRQWLICTAVALSIIAAAEIRKAVRRRTATT